MIGSHIIPNLAGFGHPHFTGAAGAMLHPSMAPSHARAFVAKFTTSWKNVTSVADKAEIAAVIEMSRYLRNIEKSLIKFRPSSFFTATDQWLFKSRRRVKMTIAPPGKPPYARHVEFRRAFKYDVDRHEKTGWVGPVSFFKSKTMHVPYTLEYGGKTNPWTDRYPRMYMRHQVPRNIDNVDALAAQPWLKAMGIGVLAWDGHEGKYAIKKQSKMTGYTWSPVKGKMVAAAWVKKFPSNVDKLTHRTAEFFADVYGLPADYAKPIDHIAPHPYVRPALKIHNEKYPQFVRKKLVAAFHAA